MMIDKQTDILADFESDLTAAKSSHSQIWSKVIEWQDVFDGEPSRALKAASTPYNSNTIFSKMYPQRDVMRVVETSLPDITSPFVSSDDIAEVQPKNANSAATAKAFTKLLNKQFSKGTDVLEFIETIGRNIQVEGTVFTKVGWGDDAPVVENIQFSELLLDPSARRMKDLRFAIQRRKVSLDDIKSNPGWYGKHSEEELSELEGVTANEYDDYRNIGYGRDDSFNFDDKARELIEVFEYYGVYDLNGNGLEPVLAIWSGNTLLRMTESPYPLSWKGIPFEAAVYTRIPFNIYGEAICEMLQSSQRMRQNISTAIVENMKNATVGQRFFQKGAMDQINFRRMIQGERIIYMNKSPQESFTEGTFTDIPQSVFAVNDMLKQEQDQLSGVSEFSAGMDPRSLNTNVSATAANITNTNAQKRMLQVTRHISEMLERVFSKWVDLNQMMLQNGVIQDDEEYVPLSGDMLQGSFDVSVKAGTAGMKQSKIQHIQMMMSDPTLPPNLAMGMRAQLADLLDMPVLAKEIREMMNQEPDPQQQQIQQMGVQLELAEKQAGITKDQAQAKKYNAEAMETFVDTERASYGLN